MQKIAPSAILMEPSGVWVFCCLLAIMLKMLTAQHEDRVFRRFTFGDADGAVRSLSAGEALAAGAAQARLGLILRPVQLSWRRLCGSCSSHTGITRVTMCWSPVSAIKCNGMPVHQSSGCQKSGAGQSEALALSQADTCSDRSLIVSASDLVQSLCRRGGSPSVACQRNTG